MNNERGLKRFLSKLSAPIISLFSPLGERLEMWLHLSTELIIDEALGLMSIKFHFHFREIRDIIGVHHLTIEFPWVALWQEEWFCDIALLIDGGKEKLGIHAILTF